MAMFVCVPAIANLSNTCNAVLNHQRGQQMNRDRVVAELRVGGPVIVNWPSGNPSITRLSQAEEFIAVWADTDSSEKPERARFMVLQDFDILPEPGELVGSVVMPWFGECSVYRLA